MGSEIEIVEERLKSFWAQFQTEIAIFERIVYKNKNQHRRCSYFQFLLKVRRDLRLLQSSKLEEILNSCFFVIYGKRPRQKVQLLESLKRRKCHGSKYNFLERLLGAARLLSQMVEPMIRAAMEISKLLAQSFFMAFSLTNLALLSRFRVLIQQMLLDVVYAYNKVFPLCQTKQSIKIAEEGIEVFREYYPKKEQNISLECVWETDKFVLVERTNETNGDEKAVSEDVSVGASEVQYHSIEVLLGDNDQSNLERESAPDVSSCMIEEIGSSGDLNRQSGEEEHTEDGFPSVGPAATSSEIKERGLNVPSSSSSSLSTASKRKAVSKENVAFSSVAAPAPSTAHKFDSHSEMVEKIDEQRENPFFTLLNSLDKKSSIFLAL